MNTKTKLISGHTVNELDLSILRSIIDYDPGTGLITWKQRRGRIPAGSVASREGLWGVLLVRIAGKIFTGNRIAWALHYGEWPDSVLEYIDGDKSNLRIENLRVKARRAA